MKNRYVAVSLILSSLIQLIFADPLTLEQCLEKALQNNKSLQQGRLNTEQSKISTKQSISSLYPSASLSMSQRTQNAGGSWNSHSGLGIGVSQSIYDPGAFTDIKVAKLNEKISHLNQEALINAIRQSVENTFFSIMTSMELIKVYRENISVAEKDLARIRKLYEVGTKTESDVLSTEVQKGKYESTLLNEEVNLKNLKRQMNLLFGESPKAGLDIRPVSAEIINIPDLETAKKRVIDNNLEYNALKLRQNINQMNLNSAKGAWLPSVSANYSYSKDLNYIGGQVVGSNSLGISASVGLFNGFRKKNNIQASKLTLINTDIQIDEKELELLSELTDYYDSMEYYNQSILLQEKNLASAQKNYELISRQYELGLSTILDQTNAQLSVMQSQSSLVKIKYSRKILESKILNLLGA